MSGTVTIVDYHAGNLTSVQLAVEALGCTALVTDKPDDVVCADRVIFPGVGAAGAAMSELNRTGLADAVREYASTDRPMLGICLGCQIVLDHSDEGGVKCLGLVKGRVKKLKVPSHVKVPHMGWNSVRIALDHEVWTGIADESQFYFVHSYVPVPAAEAAAIGVTDYHGMFVSAIAQGSLVATQFHPERSGRIGLKLLENWLHWKPQ